MPLCPIICFLLSSLLSIAPIIGSATTELSSSRYSIRGATRQLQETTARFNVVDDTFVLDSNDRNYNEVTNLGVAFGPQYNERITYLKFPIGWELRYAEFISTAIVQMRVNDVSPGGLSVNVFLCDSLTWDESVITWSNRPSYNNSVTPVTSLTVTSMNVGSWVEFDVTTAVIDAAQAFQSAISLVIESDPISSNVSSGLVKFDSREDANLNIPVLEVTYLPGSNPDLTVPPTISPTLAPTASATLAPTTAPTIDRIQKEYPQLVSLAADGSLVYVPYANEINRLQNSTANAAVVNTVPDFSNVGYKGGGVPIPFVPVKQTVSPTSGDRRADIQAAIDAVAALDINADGFRGAVLLEAGDYEVSHPGLEVLESGIVLRGQGQGKMGGTRIIFTSNVSNSYAITLGRSQGGLASIEPNGVGYSITDSFVPVGSRSFNISSAASISAGDRIVIELQPNDDWLFHMSDMAQWGWTTRDYQKRWRRQVISTNDNQLTVDSPIVQAVEAVYGGAQVYRYSLLFRGEIAEIRNVGVENIRIESIFASDTDENHGRYAVQVQRVTDGWVRQLTAQYFWNGALLLRRFSYHMTVEDSASLDPKGTLGGGRRYAFSIDDGELNLLQRLYVGDARHDFASSSRTPGPNVFVDSLSVDSYNDIGPHERFSTGQLYDNIKTSMNPDDANLNGGEMNVQNRGPSGTGHGWAGAQVMFWNSEARQWRCMAPNGGMNWAVGMIGRKGVPNRIPEPDGIIQSHGNHVVPRSLYYTQLQERVGLNALFSMILPSQKIGNIWDDLANWMGDGLFGDVVVSWLDESALPLLQGSSIGIGAVIRDLNWLANSPTHSWSLSEGPGDVVFEDDASLETMVSFNLPGIYTLQLYVSNGTSNHTNYFNNTAYVVVTVEEALLTPSPSAPSTVPSTVAPSNSLPPVVATIEEAAPTVSPLGPSTVAPSGSLPTPLSTQPSRGVIARCDYAMLLLVPLLLLCL